MTTEDFNLCIDQETSWLKYYGSNQEPEEGSPNTTRRNDPYNDVYFYDRIISIGYTKTVMPLHRRCPAGFVTSKKPVLESTVEELEYVSGPRNHENNVYTPLEYAFATNYDGIDKFIEILRS